MRLTFKVPLLRIKGGGPALAYDSWSLHWILSWHSGSPTVNPFVSLRQNFQVTEE